MSVRRMFHRSGPTTPMLACMKHPRHSGGFTLIELMFTVAILAILLGIGIPSLVTTVQNGRMVAAANNALATLHIARSEAVKQRANVVVCPSANPTAVPPVCGGSMVGGGLIGFVDRNGNGQVDPNANPRLDDTVVNTVEGLDPTVFTMNANGNYIGIASTGFAQNVAALGGPSATNLVLCDTRGNVDLGNGVSAARVINISVTGRGQVLRTVADVNNAGGCP